MKYASTITDNCVERIVVILPLSAVPGFDPANPPQENTYGVPDEVQLGWIKQGGQFVASPPRSAKPTPKSTHFSSSLPANDLPPDPPR